MALRTSLVAGAAITLLAAGLAAPAALVPAAAEASARGSARPTLAVSTSDVVSGKRIRLHGRVKPATRGAVVVIQKKIGDRKWRTEKRVRTTKAGRYSYVDRPHAFGDRSYRAVVPRSATRPRAVSGPVTVTVYRWRELYRVRARQLRGTHKYPSATIDTVEYHRAFTGNRFGEQGHADWNLQRRCTKLRARVGMNDNADVAAVAHIELVADGESRFAGDFGLTESQEVLLDLSGVFRFGFIWTASNPEVGPEDDPGALATMVEARVLCSF